MSFLKRFFGKNEAAGSKEPQPPAVLPGRNEECWCGSGEKYKKCHLGSDQEKLREKSQEAACTPFS